MTRSKRRRKKLLRSIIKTALTTFMLTTVVVAFAAFFFYLKHEDNPLLSADSLEISIEEPIKNDNFTIVIDAGHGGKDQGTSYGDILEKDVNLEVAEKTAFLLKKAGFNVILTRDSDVFVELPDRAAISNNNNANLFISIHCNYNEDSTSINGLECHYYGHGSGESYANEIIKTLNSTTNISTRGCFNSDFHVLRNTNAPAVLIELGYFSNKTDRDNLSNKDYEKNLSEVLANAISRSVNDMQDIQ